jgi:hypothetical protein
MIVNVVLNNQPAQGVAVEVVRTVGLLDQTQGPQPPGSDGIPNESKVPLQLNDGNPGGIGAQSGVGINVNVNY